MFCTMLSPSRWLLFPHIYHLFSVLHNVLSKPLAAFPSYLSPFQCFAQCSLRAAHIYQLFSVLHNVLSKPLAAFLSYLSPYQCSAQCSFRAAGGSFPRFNHLTSVLHNILSHWLLLPHFNHLTSVLHNVLTKPLTAFPTFSSPYKCSVQAICCFPHMFIIFQVFCTVISPRRWLLLPHFHLPVSSPSSLLLLPHFCLTSVLSKQLVAFATFSPYQCSAQCSPSS